MFFNRFVTPIFMTGAAVATLFSVSGAAAAVAPVALPPGTTVTSLPNGYSSYPGDEGVTLLDDSIPFDFDDGVLSGTLRERVLKYSQQNEYHPYGGLYFDYEITLTSGDVTGFSAFGYTPLEVAVKQCGIANCGGSGANGELASSATRSENGDVVSFFFNGDLVGGTHSANLQFLTNATSFIDPPAAFENAAGEVFSLDIVGPAPVPEPSIWAMMMLGFVGLGLAGYRASRRALTAHSHASLRITSL
jgi:PEP-CTERM motif